MIVEDGGYSMQDMWHCSTQGAKGVEVLGRIAWSCMIEVENKEEMRGEGADLKGENGLLFEVEVKEIGEKKEYITRSLNRR
jgi:hypothetical protein